MSILRKSGYDEIFDYNKDTHYTMFGGNPANPSWDEYLEDFEEHLQPYLEKIKQVIIDEEAVGVSADKVCNDWFFYFEEDDVAFSFSWRGWGDLMQAIVNKREGYMTYYMDCFNPNSDEF